MKQRVIFRKFKQGNNVIAFFPDQVYREYVMSYQHIGQHGNADYNHCLSITSLATPEEYKDLFHELTKRVGYDLRIVKKWTH